MGSDGRDGILVERLRAVRTGLNRRPAATREALMKVLFIGGTGLIIAWFDADPARRRVDAEMDADWDRLIDAYERGLANAVESFAKGA